MSHLRFRSDLHDVTEPMTYPLSDRTFDVLHTFCISGEDGWCLDVVGVRTVVGKALPFAAQVRLWLT